MCDFVNVLFSTISGGTALRAGHAARCGGTAELRTHGGSVAVRRLLIVSAAQTERPLFGSLNVIQAGASSGREQILLSVCASGD